VSGLEQSMPAMWVRAGDLDPLHRVVVLSGRHGQWNCPSQVPVAGSAPQLCQVMSVTTPVGLPPMTMLFGSTPW
jgi:hypothetical protein